jgi:hypothetical protein
MAVVAARGDELFFLFQAAPARRSQAEVLGKSARPLRFDVQVK